MGLNIDMIQFLDEVNSISQIFGNFISLGSQQIHDSKENICNFMQANNYVGLEPNSSIKKLIEQ